VSGFQDNQSEEVAFDEDEGLDDTERPDIE